MKYKVFGRVYGSKYLGEFETESPQEAIEAAMAGPECYVSLCHQCSGEIDEPTICGGDVYDENDDMVYSEDEFGDEIKSQ